MGLHASRRGGVAPGARVAVLGAGPIGLVTLLSARVFGADRVAVTDLAAPKLEVARQQGVRRQGSAAASVLALLALRGAHASLMHAPRQAHATVHVSRGAAAEETAARLVEALGGPPAVVIDCCGFESTMHTALLACKRGGRVVLVGMAQPLMRLPLCAAAAREVDICGSFRYANTYSLALSLLASKRVDVAPLVTHRFGWSPAALAAGFDAAVHSERTGAIKVMFEGLAGSRST